MLGARYICASLLAVVSFSLTSANLNMNYICALVNDGLMIGSYAACDTYYMCSGGVATMQYCGAGNYFDKESQMCLPQDQVNCPVATKVPCAGYSIGTWAPAAGSCSGFYYCSANGAVLGYCSEGQNYNPTVQQCVWATMYPCSESTDIADGSSNDYGDESNVPINITLPINLCTIIPNDLYFGSPSSCYAWNECVDNVLTTGLCPTGYSYNVLQMECIYPSYDTCSQITNDPYLTANTCFVNGTIKASTSCSSYYVCDGTYYQLTECSIGLYYDTVSQTCVSPLNARNNCNRCAGVTSNFVNQYSTQNCAGFLYCLDGQEAASGVCPTGTFFNASVGACLASATEPLFGCCNPAFYDGSTTDASVTTEASGTTA